MAKKQQTPSITAVDAALNAVAAQAPVAPINPHTGLPVGAKKSANAKASAVAAQLEAQAKSEAAPVAAVEVKPDMNALINNLPEAVKAQLLALVGGGSATVAPVVTAPKVVAPKVIPNEKNPEMPEYWKARIKRQEFVTWIASGFNKEHGFWEREIFVMTTTPTYEDGTEENFRLCMASGISLGTASNIVEALRMAADLIEQTPVWTYPGKPAPKEAKTTPQVVTTDKTPADPKTGRTAQQDALIQTAAAKRKK